MKRVCLLCGARGGSGDVGLSLPVYEKAEGRQSMARLWVARISFGCRCRGDLFDCGDRYVRRIALQRREFSGAMQPANAIIRDHNGHALSHVYFENEPGRRPAVGLLTRDEARPMPINIAEFPKRSGPRRH
jgi:hypothetical protein